jgi:hypothetical protein
MTSSYWTIEIDPLSTIRDEILSSFFDQRGFEYFAVGPQKKHSVALEAHRDGRTWAELAGDVTLGGFGIVLTDVLGAINFHYDGFAAKSLRRFTQDFLFGLSPIFGVAARNSSAADIDFLGPDSNSVSLARRGGRPGLETFGSGVHEQKTSGVRD